MISALKTRGIKVAGADRLVLTEQIAVQDLMALGDFLTLPEDDLALASVLKSPLFGLDDDDLLALAPSGKASCGRSSSPAPPPMRASASRRYPETLAGAADLMPPSSFSRPSWMRTACARGCWSASAPRRPDAIDELLTWRSPTTSGAAPSLQVPELAARARA